MPTIVYPVRLPEPLYARIKAKAEIEGRSAANYMRRVLDLATRGGMAAIDGQANGGRMERTSNERTA